MNKKICRVVGFTLIELLVVVAIIGVLASLLLPSLSTAREKAKAKVCLSQLKQIGTMAIMYSDNESSYIPPCWTRNSSDTWFNTPWNDGALKLYMEDSPHAKVLICPSADQDGAEMLADRSPRDYGMNGWRWSQTGSLDAGLAWSLANSSGAFRGSPLTLNTVQVTTETLYFGDKKREIYGQQSTSGAAINGKSDTGSGGAVYNRHTKGNNFIFVDGHARYLTQAQYFTDSLWTIDPND